MYQIDPATRAITLPVGDTLLMRVRLSGGELPPGSVGVFAVCTNKTKPSTLLRKVVPLQDDVLTINLTNADTRELPIGEQRWDVRLVTDPEYDENGDVRCDDDSDRVLSLFSGSADGMPSFTVTAVAKAI